MLLGFKGQKYLFFEIVGLKGLKYQYSLFFPIYRDLFCHTIHGTLIYKWVDFHHFFWSSLLV